jgi:hypothetical protein
MTRAELHRLVDELRLVDEPPEESVDAAAVLLTRAKDPLIATLEVTPFDDEPYSGEDRAASDYGWAAHRRGEAITVAELRAESEADA